MTNLVQRFITVFRPFSTSSFNCKTFKSDPLTQIYSIVNKNPHFEPELDRLGFLMEPETMSSVLTNPPDLKSGFRFFLWATKFRCIQAYKFIDMVVDILLTRNRDHDDGFTLYWETLDELTECGVVIPCEAFLVLISGYYKAGLAEKAVESFGFCAARRLKDACNMFQEMTDKGIIPDTQCFNILIKGFCDAGLLQEALSLKLEISNNSCFPDTHTNTILICGMCRNGLVREAKQIFEEMDKEGCLPSVMTFNALIDGLCKAGQPEEARLMYYKMEIGRNPSLFLRLTQGTDRVMDKASLENLVARLCESGLYLKAYSILNKLAENGVAPNIVTYNILINGMCRSRNMDGAFKIFKELQLKGRSPDAVTYGTLINGLFQADREEEAMATVEDMIKKGISPTSSIYRSLMTWSCRMRKISMSFALWMNYLRSLKNHDNNVIRLIEEHFQKGDVEEAIRSLLKIDSKRKDFDLEPYSICLIGFCQAGRVDEALKFFQVFQEFNVTVPLQSCVRLLHICCMARKLGSAADVISYALEKGYRIPRRKCNLILCSMFRSQPHVNHAINLVKKMDAMGFNVNALLSKKTKSLWQYHKAMHRLPGIEQRV